MPKAWLRSLSGCSSQGQGHETSLAQVAAETLGVPLAQVRVRHGDTGLLAHGGGSYASRTAVMSGHAVYEAATAVRSKVLQIAAKKLEAAEFDLTLADGKISVKGAPGMHLTLGAIAQMASPGNSALLEAPSEHNIIDNEGLTATRYIRAVPSGTAAFAVHMAEVCVDTETGKIDVERYLVACDVGRALNPMIVEGQLVGGVAQGLGGTLLEALVYGPEGQFETGTFADYFCRRSTMCRLFKRLLWSSRARRRTLWALRASARSARRASPLQSPMPSPTRLERREGFARCRSRQTGSCRPSSPELRVKPAPFDYHAPKSVAEAIDILARYGKDASPLAGGQSLVPMLALRLARPSALIDLNRIPELSGIRVAKGMLCIGAMTRQADVLRSAEVAALAPLLVQALRFVGHPPTRNRGTIGGSLAHADPAAELSAALLALDGALVLRGVRGERTVQASNFFKGPFATALADAELLAEIRIPVYGTARVRSRKSRRAKVISPSHLSPFASSSTTAHDVAWRGSCSGRSACPRRSAVKPRKQRLVSRTLDESVIADAVSALPLEAVDFDTWLASRAYRRTVSAVLARRALATAAGFPELRP